MKVAESYIVKEVLKGSFVALGILASLFILFTFSDELKDIGKGDYQLREIFLFLVLTSPSLVYELMPASALLGSLFVLGSMANNRELIAMQTGGMSVFCIIKAVMLAGVVLVIFAVSIGELVAPDAEREGRMIRSLAQEKKVILQTRYGLWLREGNVFVNVRHIASENQLADVSVYQLNEDYQLNSLLHAEHADFAGAGKGWVLNNVKRTDIKTDSVVAMEMQQSTWRSGIDPGLLDTVIVLADNLSLYELVMYVDFLKKNNQKSQLFELALWGRVVNPLVIFVMLLVSTPFVIGIRRGVSVGARIMIGVLIGMGFNIVDKITGHMGLVYDLNPVVMAFLPSTVVVCIALIAISRLRA